MLKASFALVAASFCAVAPAGDLLDPAEYLKIMTASKLHYVVQSKPSPNPVEPMTCGRRDESTRVVAGEGENKSLVEWTMTAEAKKSWEQGEELFHAKKFDEAAVHYKAAVEADPASAAAHFTYGDALMFGSRQDAAAALEQYRKGLALDPTLPSGYFYSATALARLGRRDEARQAIVKALTFHPAYAVIWQVADRAYPKWNAKPIRRYRFDPPAGYMGMSGKDGIDVYMGDNGDWIGYATCKAVWRNEEQFAAKRKPDGGWSLEEERACVLNELMTRMNAAENRLAESRKKSGRETEISQAEIAAALDPLASHLFDVAQAGLLDGYILFEIIGQHCPIAMSLLDDTLLHEVEQYVQRYVIVAAN